MGTISNTPTGLSLLVSIQFLARRNFYTQPIQNEESGLPVHSNQGTSIPDREKSAHCNDNIFLHEDSVVWPLIEAETHIPMVIIFRRVGWGHEQR